MRSSAHLPTPYATCQAKATAPDELTFTIRPRPAATIGFAACQVAAYAERVPTSIMSSQFDSGVSQNGSPEVSSAGMRKALFTSTSRRPHSSATRSNSAATWASSRWSQTTPMPRPPSASTSRAVASRLPGSAASPSFNVRPVAYTVAPAAPSSSAQPLPMLRLAPVTIATCPSSAPMCS